jgi:hypothetical protein
LAGENFGGDLRMTQEERIHKRDQEETRKLLPLGDAVKSREGRVKMQYLQALEVCELLDFSAKRTLGFGSAVLFRFGLDTIATGFWIASTATDEWLRGDETLVNIPTDLSRIIEVLQQPEARALLQKVVDIRVKSADGSVGKLKDILNRATHGNALVSVNRIGSEEARGSSWSQILHDEMRDLTTEFVTLIRELSGIDLPVMMFPRVDGL